MKGIMQKVYKEKILSYKKNLNKNKITQHEKMYYSSILFNRQFLQDISRT
ncbi:hypothetical protein OTSUT76_1116 [Orientia tsutsugamushi str. UT76]|uniref:Uncharacterized protein n=1 Tax=Orientia tsutsugamushi TaxID=784 RepID=A0A2U3R2E9_ORITS|nr:hypothetical protein OTSUT76_1116 [Orientia tsutsugamushi str. UT76]SPR07359.1 Uncharacterised protein [Orientia tsutsugamushi]